MLEIIRIGIFRNTCRIPTHDAYFCELGAIIDLFLPVDLTLSIEADWLNLFLCLVHRFISMFVS